MLVLLQTALVADMLADGAEIVELASGPDIDPFAFGRELGSFHGRKQQICPARRGDSTQQPVYREHGRMPERLDLAFETEAVPVLIPAEHADMASLLRACERLDRALTALVAA